MLRTSYALMVMYLVLFVPSQTTFAFGFRGHVVITRIAWEKLSPEAKVEAERLLAAVEIERERSFAQTEQFYKDLVADLGRLDSAAERAALYPDLLRPLARDTATFHYINLLLKDEKYSPDTDREGKHVVAKLEYFLKVLADKSLSDNERGLALMWVLHLVGDIHQPLHVFSNNDKGGNEVKIRFLSQAGAAAVDTNLHAVWDYVLFEGESTDLSALTQVVQSAGKKLDPKLMHVSSPVVMANENAQLARDAYLVADGGRTIVSGDQLGAEYRVRHLPILHQRLYLAGARLANLVEASLKP